MSFGYVDSKDLYLEDKQKTIQIKSIHTIKAIQTAKKFIILSKYLKVK